MANDVVVGFIGLGTMGGKMATNILKAGYKVVVHDLHRQSAGHHLQAGAEWADTPRALAEKSDVIFTSLPEPADVERVALGADGLIEGVKKGAAYFDLSTNAQSVVKKIHDAFAAKGAHMLDAPVSGGPSGAASRKMAIWVGGDKAAFDKYKPVLDAMGDQAGLYRADRHRDGRQARAQHVRLCDHLRARRDLHHGREGRHGSGGAVGGRAPGRRRPPSHLRRPARSVPARQIRSAGFRAASSPPRTSSWRPSSDANSACRCGCAISLMRRCAKPATAAGKGATPASVMLLQQERAGVEIAADPERVKQAADTRQVRRA